jgi:hypothetical protein
MRGRRRNKIRTKREKTEDVEEKRRQLGGKVGEEIRRCEKQKNIMIGNEKTKERKIKNNKERSGNNFFFPYARFLVISG